MTDQKDRTEHKGDVTGLPIDSAWLDTLSRFETHSLKVVPPYFGAIKERDKTFEVRKNDRGFQRGDLLILNEWHPMANGDEACWDCRNRPRVPHYSGRKAVRWVSFVYSGDPRFGGVEPGHVVMSLASDDYTDTCEAL